MIDTLSDTWAEVAAFAEAQLDAARRRIEAPGLSHEETQLHRGRISALRDVLALPAAKAKSARLPGAASY